ncbi:hypothetical protein Hanom_Chr12g01082411 [Helianthus anomalus]
MGQLSGHVFLAINPNNLNRKTRNLKPENLLSFLFIDVFWFGVSSIWNIIISYCHDI